MQWENFSSPEGFCKNAFTQGAIEHIQKGFSENWKTILHNLGRESIEA